jgi:hypothetical protein
MSSKKIRDTLNLTSLRTDLLIKDKTRKYSPRTAFSKKEDAFITLCVKGRLD